MSARAALVNNKAVKGKLTELSAHFLLASYMSFELGRYYLIIPTQYVFELDFKKLTLP